MHYPQLENMEHKVCCECFTLLSKGTNLCSLKKHYGIGLYVYGSNTGRLSNHLRQYHDHLIMHAKKIRQKGTSRQRSGKGARKKIPTPKTEVGKNQTNNPVLIP